MSAPLWMAEAVHAFTDEKVTINSKFTQAAVAIPALIARELDGVIVSGAPIITADLNGNEDLVFVGSLLNHPTGALYSAPSIRTAADLRGKIVSSDRPGTPEEYSMQRALALLGLKSNDVNLLSLGSVANYVALTTGQVQAAILGNPDSFRALANGYIKLQDLSRESYQNVGVVVSRARIPGLPQLAGLLAGLRQGIVAYNSQRDLALQVLKQNTSEEDPGILDQTYELFHSVLPFDPTLKPTMEGLQAMIDFLAGTISAAKSAKAEQFVDLRFLS